MIPDLVQLNDCLKRWAEKAINDYQARSLFLFGSLIHKRGAQFRESSDVDLVILMPTLEDALARRRWLESFSEHKEALETQLMRLLRRSGAEPSASVVAVTDLELAFDIHKDGHREFFTANTFRDLATGAEAIGLPGAGSASTNRFVAGALAFTQKIRNEHFAISANGTPILELYDGPDPLPKRIMRAAAMAASAMGRTGEAGAEHDVQEGLDLISRWLYEIRDSAPAYGELQDIVSVRRNARGKYRSVDPTHQLLLAELIFDLATSKSPSAPSATSPLQGETTVAVVASSISPSAGEALLSERDLARPAERPAMPFASSTAFFAHRFASAFPGVRSPTWYNESAEIAERLLTLLQRPLSFSDGSPIWWWRGGNLHIESFERLSSGDFLMNVEELRIARIAAVPGKTYQRDFVYIQVEAMPPTGLYPTLYERLAEFVEERGYADEEYGLFNDHLLTRSEHDDGAVMINGHLVQTGGRSKLRVRYISPYNFLIAANGSPINNPAFDADLERILNVALKENAEKAVEAIRKLVNKLPLRRSSDG